MPTQTIYLRKRVFEKLIDIARREGYIKDGSIKWHSLVNDLLEQAIALYEIGQIKVRKKFY